MTVMTRPMPTTMLLPVAGVDEHDMGVVVVVVVDVAVPEHNPFDVVGSEACHS